MTPHRVAVLVRPGILPLELGIGHQLFGSAETPGGTPLYEVVTCALEPGAVRTDADFTVTVGRGREALACAETVLVPASHERDGVVADPELTAVLTGLPAGTRIAAICTGAFALADAGLLDGRRATTHWRSAGQFRARYPGVRLDADVLYVDEGDVLTSAGEAAGIDLCLHLIRRDHGAAVANEVARRTVVPPYREGGQAQYVRRPVPEDTVASTHAARAWALDHLDRPLTLAELAARGSMSVRTFTRRFREETGMSPARWLVRHRVDRARALLEESDLPIDRVAAESGFGTAASMRAHLHAALGVSPSSYRATFRRH